MLVMPAPAIALHQVAKRYRSRPVLRGVDLDLRPGTVTRIEGRNGSGKSTLLRIAAGMGRPTSGTVTRTARTVGYLPDRAEWTHRLPCRSYLAHQGRIRGLDDHAVADRLAELSERLAIDLSSDQLITELSVGTQQKALLATVFLAPAELLVLDEPNAGLDPAALDVVAELITEAASRATVLITAHGAWSIDADLTLQLEGGRLRPAEQRRSDHDHPDLIVTVRIDGRTVREQVTAGELSDHLHQVLRAGGRIDTVAAIDDQHRESR